MLVLLFPPAEGVDVDKAPVGGVFFSCSVVFLSCFFCDVDDAPVGASWPVFAKFLSTAFLGLRT